MKVYDAGEERSLVYNSQINLNRMTGNWWFPYDIFVVPQGNGDLHLYSPGIVAAVYQWNAVNQTFTSPPGFFDVMVANGNGTWTRTTKDGTVWQFNTAGYLITVTNRYGLATTINRDPQQAITSIVDYAGRSTTFSYNASGYVSSITDWGGRTTTFAYTPQGYLATITKPATTFYDRTTSNVVTRGKTITFAYTSGTGTTRDGNLLTATDDRGQNLFTNAYDTADRNTSITMRGRTWNHTYQAGGSTQVVDPDGVTTLYSFNATGAIIRKETFTKTGLGQAALRPGEPNSYVWQYERNAACGCDFISKITYPDGTTRSFTYDSWGNMLSETLDPPPGASGSQIKRTWTYSSFSQFCRTLTYTKPEGYAPGATAADHTYTWTHDATGSVVQSQWPKATVNGSLQHPIVTYTRNAAGKALSRTWPSGRKDTFEWASTTYHLSKITTDADGIALATTCSLDTYGRLTSRTNPRGFSTSRSYNALDQLTQVTPPQPLGPVATYLYDNQDNVYRIEVENKDATGTVDSTNPLFTTTTDYNTNNFLVGVTQEVDVSTTATTAFEWTPGGRLKRVTDPNGDVIEFEYDERGLLFKSIEAPGTSVAGTVQVDYDLNGRPSRIVDPRGNATLTQFDHVDRPTLVTFADSTKMMVAYDRNSNVVTVERADTSDVVKERTTYEYDPHGLRLTGGRQHLDGAGNTTQTDTTSYAYDSGLRLKSVTDPLGNATTITWDGLSRMSVKQDAATHKVEFTYDGNGNPTVVKRFDWNQVTSAYDQLVLEHTYDALDRRTGTTRRDLGSTLLATTASEYDGRGLPTKFTDELGNTTRQEWDARGLLVKTLKDLRAGGTGQGAITSTITNTYAYDLGGRLLSLTDGLGNATTYEYDERSRVKEVTNAAAQLAQFAYDANGNQITKTDPVGTVVTSTYDSMNRLTGQTVTPGAGVLGDTSLSIAYDALGRPTSIVDNDSTVQQSYDSLSRLTAETQGPNPLGGAGKIFSFAYDAAGRRTQVTFPDGTVEQRNRDAIGRLTSVAIAGGSTLATYQYSGGRVPSLTLANSVVRTNTYDALFRRTMVEYKQNTTSLKKFEYIWNLADQRLLEKRHHSGGTGDNYKLDSLYRTTEVKAGVADPVAEHQNPGSQTVTSTTTLTVDAAQNRTQVSVSTGGTPTVTTYTPDALNFYTNVGGAAHVRDANGNLKDDGTFLYDYDYRNQLVKVTKKSDSSIVATYEYDTLGRRISKAVSAGTRSFYWIGKQLAAEYDAQGLFSRRHHGRAFGSVVSAQQRDIADLDQDGSTNDFVSIAPLYDGAFDCVGALDHTGGLAESYVHSYDGTVLITNGAGQPLGTSGVGWHQGYGCMYRDAESGFLYSVHRYYSPAAGRFVTEDPLGRWFDVPNRGNGYAWVGNQHRNGWDPLGLDFWVEGGGHGDSPLHLRFSVGDPNGDYVSASFGWTGGVGPTEDGWGLKGAVFLDPKKGGEIDPNRYYKTPPHVTEFLKRELRRMIWERRNKRWLYSLRAATCRSYSRDMFALWSEWAKKHGIGGKAKPPKRPLDTAGFGAGAGFGFPLGIFD